jgi:hypothetical protein
VLDILAGFRKQAVACRSKVPLASQDCLKRPSGMGDPVRRSFGLPGWTKSAQQTLLGRHPESKIQSPLKVALVQASQQRTGGCGVGLIR